MDNCFFCRGSGFWEDPFQQQTLFCPFCQREQAEHQSLARLPATTAWAPSMWPTMKAKYYGPRFQVEPTILVLHSGANHPNVAEFFAETGYVVYDGRRVKVSAHVNWSAEEDGFVQSVPLSHVAWHVGGSKFKGIRRLNLLTIGIELPGPWKGDRSAEELGLLRSTVEAIVNMVPTIKICVRHSDIDSNKKDPGPGYEESYLDGLGLTFPFRK